MPNASAANAPCVLVCESPQTTVIPGSVAPCSGPITWTMPWRRSRNGKYAFAPCALHVGVERLDLRARDRIARCRRLQSLVGVLWSAVATIEPTRHGLRPASRKPFVGLRARHLVDEVAVDVEQRRAVRLGANDVAVPELVVERACVHGRLTWPGTPAAASQNEDYCTAAMGCQAGRRPGARDEVDDGVGEPRHRRIERRGRRRAEPGELAFRELARRGDARRPQRRGIDAAVEELPGLPVADAAHRRQIGVQRVARAQCRELVDEARGEHGVEAFARSSACSAARSGGHERDRDRRGRARHPPRARPAARRAAGRQSRRPRARAGSAARRWPRGARRSRGSTRARSACSAGHPSAAARASRRARTRRIGGGQRREPVAQRLEIEHRAADDERHRAARANAGDGRHRVRAEPRGRIRVGRDR